MKRTTIAISLLPLGWDAARIVHKNDLNRGTNVGTKGRTSG